MGLVLVGLVPGRSVVTPLTLFTRYRFDVCFWPLPLSMARPVLLIQPAATKASMARLTVDSDRSVRSQIVAWLGQHFPSELAASASTT